ncbi:MAG: 50S ribosomal protein L23 [Flavobacteriales bacterium]|jgi:large subunit ribosomal protein L23|nr:50S ribosomal protein L23 [Flavobacteriales bacterium]
MRIIIKPIISEKMTNDSEVFNRYGFVVNNKANKIQIRTAVEAAYGVAVAKVRTMNYPVKRSSKFTKKGMVTSVIGAYKKAIVELAEGDSIDFYNNI